MTRRYRTGLNRHQTLLLPPSIEEYVSDNNPVRAVDTYIESLDVKNMGFQHTDKGSALGGGPAYPPKMLLKLYLYGYLNRIRSSRRLERECRLNLELIWLLEGEKPSHASIANFRKNNLDGIKQVNSDFTQLCRELELFGGREIAIDGTFMKGNASKSSIYTKEQLEKQSEKLEKDIADVAKYLEELEENDQTEQDVSNEDKALADKLKRLKQKLARSQARLDRIEEGETQLSETDPDARLLTKRKQTTAGYNAQMAVDAKNKLIVCNNVVNDGNDTQQLAPMALEAKEVLDAQALIANADSGYENYDQIKDCVDASITPYMPLKDRDAQTQKQGRYPRSAFKYDAKNDCYQCPADNLLKRTGTQKKNGKLFWRYASKVSQCSQCEHRQQCLPKTTGYRQLTRWEHEHIIEDHRERMEQSGREHMITRASLAEHPFGTMKSHMGLHHFLMRGLEKVRAEMNLQVLAYNFKRVMSLVRISAFKKHLKQRMAAY